MNERESRSVASPTAVEAVKGQSPSTAIKAVHAWVNEVVHPQDLTAGSVVMVCGVAGSGKTTAALRLEATGFTRLSIDEEIWQTSGRYGIDYAPSSYSDLQRFAEKRLWTRLLVLLDEKRPVVIDYSFWRRETRERYRSVIEMAGRRRILLYFKVPPETLRARLLKRRKRFDANAAVPIDDALLDRYLASFQEPAGEGEAVFRA